MTTYNTGNPIGSKDPRDLYDNAENLDEAVNTRQDESWNDRFGVARKTWWGMEQDFQQFLINSGYENIGDYAAGLEITARNQIFWRDGELYRAGAVLELPYTTTGDWGDEEGMFVSVGDQALRQELANTGSVALGAAMIGRNAVAVRTVDDLVNITSEGRRADLLYVVKEYSASSGAGGGVFYWDPNNDRPVIQGVILQSSHTEVGRWVRMVSGRLDIKIFGAVGDGLTDDSPAFQAAASLNYPVLVTEGSYLLVETISLRDGFDWKFSKSSRIINGKPIDAEWDENIFQAVGSSETISQLAQEYPKGYKGALNLEDIGDVSVGDVLAFPDTVGGWQQFHAVCIGVSGNAVTLDRAPSCRLSANHPVLRITPITGKFDGASFDGNGTTAVPRYGFGFFAMYYRDIIVRNIYGINMGSRLVELARGMDGLVDNVEGVNFTDVGGGRGYVVRFSVGNDNIANNIKGMLARHVVDITSGSRNLVTSSVGHKGIGVDFLTHFNGCVDNKFIDCDSYSAGRAAYGSTANEGDENNIYKGGVVVDSSLWRENFTNLVPDFKGNVVKDTTIKSTGLDSTYLLYRSCDLVDCTLESHGVTMFADGIGPINIRATGCTFIMTGAGKALAGMTQGQTVLEFTDCTFKIENLFTLFRSTNPATQFIFKGCTFNISSTSTSNNQSIMFGSFNAEFHGCEFIGIFSRVAFSTGLGNTILIRNTSAPQALQLVGRSDAPNVIDVNVDRQTLWTVPQKGIGSFNIVEPYNLT